MFGTLIGRVAANPWEELWTLDRVFDEVLNPRITGYPKTEAWVKDEQAHVVVELPGVEPGSVDVAVEGALLTITGERKTEGPGEGYTETRKERWAGKFERTLTLPFKVEQGKVQAKLANGILSVTLPKAEEEKPRKISITA